MILNTLKSLFSVISSDGDALSTAEAKTRLDSGDPLFILDVRQPEEFRIAHIMGARLIPLGELPRRIKEIPTDCDILCVCASGSRSSVATRQLRAAGYKAFNLHRGMGGWQYAGYPIKKGNG